MRYLVAITPDDGQFTATFPDVPEAVTFGETREEALQRSADALLTIFDALIKDRCDIPEPSQVAKDAIELPALESAKIELNRAMRARNVGKAELARRLDWHLPQFDRVLQVRHGSQLDQMVAAFAERCHASVALVGVRVQMPRVIHSVVEHTNYEEARFVDLKEHAVAATGRHAEPGPEVISIAANDSPCREPLHDVPQFRYVPHCAIGAPGPFRNSVVST